jgi:hypothetical protein
MRGEQALADRGLPRLHGALDVVSGEQRAIRMRDDLQPAGGGSRHAIGKLGCVLRMKFVAA